MACIWVTPYPPLVDLDQLNLALDAYVSDVNIDIDIDELHRYMYIPRINQVLDESTTPPFSPNLPAFINPTTGETDLDRYLSTASIGGIDYNRFPFAFTTDLGLSNLAADPNFGGL